ncbi:hypothetical protein ACFP8W_12890, partial [Nocardioides hankookensis]
MTGLGVRLVGIVVVALAGFLVLPRVAPMVGDVLNDRVRAEVAPPTPSRAESVRIRGIAKRPALKVTAEIGESPRDATRGGDLRVRLTVANVGRSVYESGRSFRVVLVTEDGRRLRPRSAGGLGRGLAQGLRVR